MAEALGVSELALLCALQGQPWISARHTPITCTECGHEFGEVDVPADVIAYSASISASSGSALSGS